jgi:hypothetical protein
MRRTFPLSAEVQAAVVRSLRDGMYKPRSRRTRRRRASEETLDDTGAEQCDDHGTAQGDGGHEVTAAEF